MPLRLWLISWRFTVAQLPPINVDALYMGTVWRRGLPRGEADERHARIPLTRATTWGLKKKRQKSHLSPSRRRAVRVFFLQIRLLCKLTFRPAQSRGKRGKRQLHGMQRFAKKCRITAPRLRRAESGSA